MELAIALGATLLGLMLGIVLANACADWARDLWRFYRAAPIGARSGTLLDLTLKRREPWLIVLAVTGALLLPREPWARGLLAAGTAWLAFFPVAFLIAFGASTIYSAVVRPRRSNGDGPT